MQLIERSYGGKLFRPRPEVYVSDDQQLLIIATPWGPAITAREFIDIVSTRWRESGSDPDKTANYSIFDSMDADENRLRMAIQAAHEDIKDKYNDEEIVAGLEVLCILRNDRKITWFQVGTPFTSIIRDNKLFPVHHPVDLSFDLSTDKALPPLPKELLGFQNQVNIECGNFRAKKNDKLLFISRSYVPFEFFQMAPSTLDIENVTATLAQENEDHPFWIGILEL